MQTKTSPSKGEATRAAILEEALTLSSEIGLESLSIASLAKRVGMSKSGLFAHFMSKERLQIGVLDACAIHFRAEVIGPAQRQPRGLPRLQALFDRWLEWERDAFPGGCPFIGAASEYDDRPGLVRERVVHHQRAWVDALTSEASRAISEGHLAASTDPGQLVFDLYSIILAYHHFRRLLADPLADQRSRESYERLICQHAPQE